LRLDKLPLFLTNYGPSYDDIVKEKYQAVAENRNIIFCPSCNKKADLINSLNKSYQHYLEYCCHNCNLVIDVKVYQNYHPFINAEYNRKRKGHGRGFS